MWTHTLACTSDNVVAHNNLGDALLQMGKVDDAMVHYQQVLAISPDSAIACNNLGFILFQKRRVDEAMVYYRKALQIEPDQAEVRHNLGMALMQNGRADEAIAQYRQALQIKPDYPAVLNDLAWLLATSADARLRDGAQAVEYAGRACKLTHYGVTIMVGTLAAAYAEAGRFDEAIATAQKACALATAAGNLELLKKNQELLELYRVHQSYHQAAEKHVPTHTSHE